VCLNNDCFKKLSAITFSKDKGNDFNNFVKSLHSTHHFALKFKIGKKKIFFFQSPLWSIVKEGVKLFTLFYNNYERIRDLF